MTNGRAGMSMSGALPKGAPSVAAPADGAVAGAVVAVSTKADDARRALLERTAGAAGAAWAGEQIVALRTERRRIVGGWPGTMGEARVRSRSSLASTLTGRDAATRGARPFTAEELEIAARATYASARSAWNANAEREGSDVSDSEVTDTEDA